MSNVLSKQESEFINALTLNEKSKNTVDKYARDIKDFILWCEGMGQIMKSRIHHLKPKSIIILVLLIVIHHGNLQAYIQMMEYQGALLKSVKALRK